MSASENEIVAKRVARALKGTGPTCGRCGAQTQTAHREERIGPWYCTNHQCNVLYADEDGEAVPDAAMRL